jgi:uncharacterized protein (TIGR04141 family)
MKLTARLSKPGVQINYLMKNDHNLGAPLLNWANIPGCEVYYGTSYQDLASWSNFIASGTTARIRELRNQGAAAIIFVPIQNRYMIFLFGYGGHQLSGLGLEGDFGLKVVLNTVDPDKIRSVDSKIIETLVINKRTQLSKEKQIKDFGFEINKDFLKQLVGTPANSAFSSSIAGSDSLILNCDVTSTSLLQKATEIINNYNSTHYRQNYRWFDNIKHIKDKTAIDQLNNSLVTELNNLLQARIIDIQAACPTVIDYNSIDHFRIRGYRSSEQIDFVNIDAIIQDLLINNINSITLDDLNSFKIDAVGGDLNVVNSWYLIDWLIFETVLNGTHYFLSEGDWFVVSRNYFNQINATFNNIINNNLEYQVLAPTTHQNERQYLNNYPVRPTHERIFDQDETYIYGNRNSVEICDIYNTNKEFIHVKDGGASSKLSHLFNQGYVSASLFLNDINYRNDIIAKLDRRRLLIGSIENPINPMNYTIVYRILKNGQQFSLPFFSKIVLKNVHEKIISMGYKFRLEWIRKQ